MKKANPIPVIIDTDFGGDPDDALALFYALHSSELEILAIVTSDEYHGGARAQALSNWLKLDQRTIPVFSGADLGNERLFFLQAYAKNALPTPKLNDPVFASVLNRLAQRGGTYVSIGGLTNLSQLLPNYPEVFKSIAITVMGGAFNYRKKGMAEHNVRLDVAAAHKVFHAGLKLKWVLSDHTFVPQLKVDRQHHLYTYFARGDAFQKLVSHNMDQFFDQMYPDSRLHDPLTISSVFLPTVKFAPQKTVFSPVGEFIHSDSGQSTTVSVDVDYTLFWKDFEAKLQEE